MNEIASPVRRLLIFDDDPAVGITIGNIAVGIQFEIQIATDPVRFFEIFNDWNPTHIAIDLVMPEVDGIEAMRRLGELKCMATIIITSGVGTRVLDAAKRAATEHGLHVSGVVSKPFSPAALRDILTKNVVPIRKANRRPPLRQVEWENTTFTSYQIAASIERGEFRVFYQPKIACLGGGVAGFEGLVRWFHPAEGVVTPDSFIPVAESSGLIGDLTDRVLDEGIAWLSDSYPGDDYVLSLNLSAKTLCDVGLADQIEEKCRRHSIDRGRIILEITESSAMDESVATLDLLTRFRLKGFQLSIDDFGVGYSSLIQLARLPFSEMKIDKSFVMSAHDSEESRNIIKGIIELGRSLGIRVTAEGVESEQVLSFLCRANCDLAQGYLIGRPMDGETAKDWMKSRR